MHRRLPTRPAIGRNDWSSTCSMPTAWRARVSIITDIERGLDSMGRVRKSNGDVSTTPAAICTVARGADWSITFRRSRRSPTGRGRSSRAASSKCWRSPGQWPRALRPCSIDEPTEELSPLLVRTLVAQTHEQGRRDASAGRAEPRRRAGTGELRLHRRLGSRRAPRGHNQGYARQNAASRGIDGGYDALNPMRRDPAWLDESAVRDVASFRGSRASVRSPNRFQTLSSERYADGLLLSRNVPT
jgi:hypothetical protein